MLTTLTQYSINALANQQPDSFKGRLLAGAARWLSLRKSPPAHLSPLQAACYRLNWIASGDSSRIGGRLGAALVLADERIVAINKQSVDVFRDGSALAANDPISSAILPARTYIRFNGGDLGLPRVKDLLPGKQSAIPEDVIVRTDNLVVVVNGYTLQVFHNLDAYYGVDAPVIEIPMREGGGLVTR